MVLRGGLREAVLVCGVLILGDTYDRGEEASDVRGHRRLAGLLGYSTGQKERRQRLGEEIVSNSQQACTW